MMDQKILAGLLGAFSDTLHRADGFPIPVCHFKRAHFSPVFDGVAAYGYCASKSETYYGFKGNLLINSEGLITAITATAANIDERESECEISLLVKINSSFSRNGYWTINSAI